LLTFFGEAKKVRRLSGRHPDIVFAHRSRTQEAQTTAAIVISTLAFVVIAPLWLTVLGWL